MTDERAKDRSEKAWLVAMAVMLALYAWLVYPNAALIQGDAGGYLKFIPRFQITYPLLLKLIGPFSIVIVQPVCYALAVFYLAVQCALFTQSKLFATMIAVGLVANPDLNWYHGVVMSESFFVTTSIATLASMIRFTRKDETKKSIVFAALFAGITASLRPTGYAFLPAVIILILMHRQALGRRFWRTLAIGFFIMLAVVGAERIGWRIIHGPEARGYAAQQLFAKAALIDAPAQAQAEIDPVRRVFIEGLERDFKPIRDVIDKAPTANIRQFLTLFYEECLEFGCSYPLATQLGKEPDDLVLNDIKLSVALERIARAPLNYANLVWVHYRSLWHIYAHNHPGFMEEFTRFADPLRPLPFSEVKQTQIFNTDIPPKKIALVARPAVMAVGMLTAITAALGLIGLFRRRIGSFLTIAATSSLAAHGALLLTAMLGLGLARYTMAVWPEMVVGSLFALWAVWKALKKQDI